VGHAAAAAGDDLVRVSVDPSLLVSKLPLEPDREGLVQRKENEPLDLRGIASVLDVMHQVG